MALSGIGFDGTVDEAEWAKQHLLGGVRHTVASAADFAASQVAGARAVTIAAGEAYAPGVRAINSAPATVNFAAPGAGTGAFWLVSCQRDWTNNRVTIEAIAGPTTDTTVPTSPPALLPAIETSLGVKEDQPLYWAWVTAANNTVTLFDLRQLPLETRVPHYGSVADLNALRRISTHNLFLGERVYVVELSVDFRWTGAGWRQDGVATVADLAARDAAYAKGGGAYLVPSARVRRTDMDWVEQYLTARVGTAGWFIIDGHMPWIELGKSGSESTSPTAVQMTDMPWNVEVADKWGWHDTAVNTPRITPGIVGRFAVNVRVPFTSTAAIGAGIHLVKNTTPLDTLRQESWNSGGWKYTEISGEVTLGGATDSLLVRHYANTASVPIATTSCLFQLRYVGPA